VPPPSHRMWLQESSSKKAQPTDNKENVENFGARVSKTISLNE